MKRKIFIVTTLFLFCNCFVEGQISKEDICALYSQIVLDIKEKNIKVHSERDLFVNDKIDFFDDFVQYLKVSNHLFGDELETRSIDYTKFSNKTDKIFLDSCFNKDIKTINMGLYRDKKKRFKRKSIGICNLSNIAFYDNYAFIHVSVELSFNRIFGNYYFYKKEKNKWELIYSKTDVD